MRKAWEQEKARKEKRASNLKEMMIADIKNNDKKSFKDHYKMTLGCMKKKDRQNLMMAFISHCMN